MNSSNETLFIKPPKKHPRLMLQETDIKRISRNLKHENNKKAYRLYLELLSVPVQGKGATPEYGTYNLKEYLALEATAFAALLNNDEILARHSIDTTMMLLDGFQVNGGNMAARWGGHLIFTTSQVYDWCYSYLTNEEKLKMIEACEEISKKYFEMGYPPSRQGAISGHGSEAQLLRDLLAFSIAVYDERPDIYDFCAARIFSEYIPSNEFFFSSQAHTQGPAYGSYRYSWNLWAALLIQAMSGEQIYGEDFILTSHYFLHMTRPDGGIFRLGDDYIADKYQAVQAHPFYVPMFLSAVYSNDALCKKYATEHYDDEFLLPSKHGMDFYDDGCYGEGILSPVSFLIWNRPNDYTKDDVCLSKYKHFPFPLGMTVWNDPMSGVAVLMKAGELWGANHDHLDTGCFQIFYRGILASDSGFYDSYNSPHRKRYGIHTSAHNCITVKDPDYPSKNEWEAGMHDDGGTRRPQGGKEPKTIEAWKENYRMAYVLSHTESDELCEIVIDMTPAYIHTCEKIVRTMRWEPKLGKHGVLTVIDEVTSHKAQSEKTFHIHTQNEPFINGNIITIDNKGGRLRCEILMPQDSIITSWGGDGKRYTLGDEDNVPTSLPPNSEAGWGEIRISSRENSKYTRFVVSMEILDTE